jgi:hypothetical protein
MIKPHKHLNRYDDEFIFTPNEDGNVLWEGEFKYCRFSCDNEDINKITMIDPSGGPYLAVGTQSQWVHPDIKGKIVEGFEKIPTGYKVLLK